MSVPKLMLALALTVVGARSAPAAPIDFEDLTSEELLTSQYAGLTFTNAVILTAGISLNEFELPPRSGANVAVDASGPMTISFAAPVLSFGAYFSYYVPVTLTAFDALDNSLGSITSLFSSNIATEPGALPNELISLTYLTGISSVTITGDLAGGSFAMDDATIGPLANAEVPEPATIALMSVGIAAGIGRRLRKARS